MVKLFFYITLLLLPALALGQRTTADTSAFRRSRLNVGEYETAIRPDGTFWILRKNMPPQKQMLDTNQVKGYGQQQAIQDARISSRTAFQSMADLRASSLSVQASPGVITLTDEGIGGNFVLDPTDNSSPDNTGTLLVTASGRRYKRIYDTGAINPLWFAAKGNGLQNDRAMIQAAVNLAKQITTANGGSVRAVVRLPAGRLYRINGSPIDITNANGVYVMGEGGRYLSTLLNGNTGGAILDFTGATMSGCENITFVSDVNETTPSTIGVQVALSEDTNGTQLGGLNPVIRNCYFQMGDLPLVNGGLGSIGILNIRAEEFSATDCLIKANSPIILSSQANLGPVGATSFTVSSGFARVAHDAPTGSMGVSTLKNISIQAVQCRRPGLTLLNANSVFFEGYISRTSATAGDQHVAILAGGSCANIHIKATIESFSTLLRVPTALQGGRFDLITANQTDSNQPLYDLTGASLIDDVQASLSLPNISERDSRWLVWHAPNAGGSEPIGLVLSNCSFACRDLPDNAWVMPGWLAKAATNVKLNTAWPAEKYGGIWKTGSTRLVSLGTRDAVLSAPVLTFKEAALNDGANGKAGGYAIEVEGLLTAGAHYATYSAARSFHVVINQSQSNLGVKDAPGIRVVMGSQSATSLPALSIDSVSASLTFSGGIGTLSLTPIVTGTASGSAYPVNYAGQARIQAVFHAQDPLILN